LFPVAHIASAILFNRLAYNDESVIPAAVGSLVPDAIDKPLAWVLRVTPSSHHFAHTPLAAGALALLTARLYGRAPARSVASAYLLHLVTDDLHHGRVPWLLPFSRYKRLPHRRDWRLLAVGLVLEALSAAFLLRAAASSSPHDDERAPPQDGRASPGAEADAPRCRLPVGGSV